jgi:hypothetical protein
LKKFISYVKEFCVKIFINLLHINKKSDAKLFNEVNNIIEQKVNEIKMNFEKYLF